MIFKKQNEIFPDTHQEVCRSFTFYNRYYYDVNYLKTSVTYTTLGFFDGFCASKVPLPIGDKYSELFYPLWEKSETLVTKDAYDIDCSFQNIFGFSNDEEDDFWPSEDNEHSEANYGIDDTHPITFVVLLQSLESPKRNLSDEISSIKNEISSQIEEQINQASIEEEQKEKYKFKICSYATVDKFDIIICIKSNTYNYVLNSISKFCCGNSSRTQYRTYTVVAFNNKYISSTSQEKIHESVNGEILSLICIKGVFNPLSLHQNSSSDIRNEIVGRIMDYLKRNLYSNYTPSPDGDGKTGFPINSYFMVGDEDVRFLAYDVELSKFIKLFAYNENSDSPLFDSSSGFCRFDSDINVLFNEISAPPDSTQKQHTPSQINKYSNLLSFTTTLVLEKIREKQNNTHMLSPLIKPISQLQKAFEAMEHSPSRTYEYLSLYFAFFSTLVHIYNSFDAVATNFNTNNTSENSLNIEQHYVSILKILYQISSTHLLAMRSDIRNFQISNFHVNLYYVPSKLRALYSVFTYELVKSFRAFYSFPKKTEFFKNDTVKEKLNEYSIIFHLDENLVDKSELAKISLLCDAYTFIICPGLYMRTTIHEIVGNISNNRIMICKMPEGNQYKIKSTLIQLAHEVSHHGLSTIRNREKRFDCFLKGYIRSIVCFYKTMLFYYFWRSKENDKISPFFNNENQKNFIQHTFWEQAIRSLNEILTDATVDSELINIVSKAFESNKHLTKYYNDNANSEIFYSQVFTAKISAAFIELSSTPEDDSFTKELSNCVTYHYIRQLRTNINAFLKKPLHKDDYNLSIASIEINIGRFIELKTKKIISYYAPLYIGDSRRLREKTASSFHAQYLDLFNECFADLISILTLGITFTDYLLIFKDELCKCSLNEKDMSSITWTFVSRVTVIILVIKKLASHIRLSTTGTDDCSWLDSWPTKTDKKAKKIAEKASAIFSDCKPVDTAIEKIIKSVLNDTLENIYILSLSNDKGSQNQRKKTVKNIERFISSDANLNEEKMALNLAIIAIREYDVFFYVVNYLVECGISYISESEKLPVPQYKNLFNQINRTVSSTHTTTPSSGICDLVEAIDNYLKSFEKSTEIGQL